MTVSTANIYNFDPNFVAAKMAEQDWAGCWEYIGDVIENMTLTASTYSLKFSMQLQKDMGDERVKKYVNDFGALLGELLVFMLTEKTVALPDKSFYRLIVLHETIHTLFYIFGMGNTEDYVRLLIGDGKKKLSITDQKKVLLLLSLDTELDISSVLRMTEGSYKTAAVVAYSGHRKIFRKNVYDNKVKLYDWRQEFNKAGREYDDVFKSTVTTYFLSSYLNIPNKHSIKENINALCKQYLASLSRNFKKIQSMDRDQIKLKIDPARPTILVIAELFAKNHAMYRGWGKLIKSLKSEFNIVFIMPADRWDEALRDDFENCQVFDSLGDVAYIVHAVKPDIVFMPSVGMRFYNVILSNLRMAPIQLMGLGHPATSMSDEIDYVISPGGLYDPAAFPKDIYIADGYPEKHMPLVSRDKFFEPIPENPRPVGISGKPVIRVGVVGSDIKVSYPFFRLLKDIVETSPFEVHVSFMMGVGGIDSLYIEKYLKENFANSIYHGWQDYESYLKNIKAADIILNPFPFGHTNTIIDTLMCGKPCVGLDGVEPSSKTEGDVLNAVGLREMFVAKDEAEYKEKFIALSQRVLDGDTKFYDRQEVYDRIFAELGDYDYGKVMKWVYDNNDKLKSTGKKYYTVYEDI